MLWKIQSSDKHLGNEILKRPNEAIIAIRDDCNWQSLLTKRSINIIIVPSVSVDPRLFPEWSILLKWPAKRSQFLSCSCSSLWGRIVHPGGLLTPEWKNKLARGSAECAKGLTRWLVSHVQTYMPTYLNKIGSPLVLTRRAVSIFSPICPLGQCHGP